MQYWYRACSCLIYVLLKIYIDKVSFCDSSTPLSELSIGTTENHKNEFQTLAEVPPLFFSYRILFGSASFPVQPIFFFFPINFLLSSHFRFELVFGSTD